MAVGLDEVLEPDKNTTHILNRSRMPEYPNGDFRTYLREWVLNVFDPDDLTFKDLIEFLRWKPYFPVLVGDARKIADWLEQQLDEENLDGVQLFPPYHRGPAHLVDLVVPELQRRGIYRTAYEASTFKKTFGQLDEANPRVLRRARSRPSCPNAGMILARALLLRSCRTVSSTITVSGVALASAAWFHILASAKSWPARGQIKAAHPRGDDTYG